jgi:hypothetical protein
MIVYYSLAALNASSDIFAHSQEHLNCIYSFWYYTRMFLPVGIMVELELTSSAGVHKFSKSLGAASKFLDDRKHVSY